MLFVHLYIQNSMYDVLTFFFNSCRSCFQLMFVLHNHTVIIRQVVDINKPIVVYLMSKDIIIIHNFLQILLIFCHLKRRGHFLIADFTLTAC